MAAHQAHLSLGFFRQEHWSGLPFPSPMHESEKVKVKLLSHVWLFVTPWTAAYQDPPSMEFSRQEYWSGVPLPSPFQSELTPMTEPQQKPRFQIFMHQEETPHPHCSPKNTCQSSWWCLNPSPCSDVCFPSGPSQLTRSSCWSYPLPAIPPSSATNTLRIGGMVLLWLERLGALGSELMWGNQWLCLRS